MATIAQRQPSVPPASAAMAPTKNGPITRPSGRPMFSNANIRVRTPIGYLSAMSDGEIGMRAEAPNPAAARAKPRPHHCATALVQRMATAQIPVAAERILVRE